jgi:peptidoglycan/LPS O-acetylase OafA/YrhL
MMDAGQKSLLRPDIQALRAIAILAVVICHMNPKWLPGGYLGVDMFFVISGFVITQSLLIQEKLNVWKFWLQRFFRIVPAYIVMLGVIGIATSIVFTRENFTQFKTSWLEAILFFSNQYFSNYGDYFSPKMNVQPLLHTWSLAIEMQFYLLFPIIFLLSKRLNFVWFLLIVSFSGFVAAELIWRGSSNSQTLYYWLFLRAPEFLLGCSLAIILNKYRFEWVKNNQTFIMLIGLGLILFSINFIDGQKFSPATAAIICLGVALVITAEIQSGWIFKLLGNLFVQLIGLMSFSIYLWHWPVLAYGRYIYGNFDWSLQLVAGYIFFVSVAGYLSWMFIENKYRLNFKNTYYFNFLKIAPIICLGISPIVFAQDINSKIPDLPLEYKRYADAATICHGKVLPSCDRGSKSSERKILLIGDSHAAQLNLAADVLGNELDTKIEVITASNCLPIDGFDLMGIPEYSREQCLNQIKIIDPLIKKSKNIILAGMWSYQLQNPKNHKSIKNLLRYARNNKKNIWVLAQVPKMKSNPQRVAHVSHLGLRVPTQMDTDWYEANLMMRKMIAQYPNVKFLDLSKDDFFDDLPFNRGDLIYHDEHHLNEIGSKRYGEVLINEFRKYSLAK